MSLRITAYPTEHTWTNTPTFRAQMRQAELLRIPLPKPKTLRQIRREIRREIRRRFKDTPHWLPFSKHDLHITWDCVQRWFIGWRKVDQQLVTSGKSRPLEWGKR